MHKYSVRFPPERQGRPGAAAPPRDDMHFMTQPGESARMIPGISANSAKPGFGRIFERKQRYFHVGAIIFMEA